MKVHFKVFVVKTHFSFFSLRGEMVQLMKPPLIRSLIPKCRGEHKALMSSIVASRGEVIVMSPLPGPGERPTIWGQAKLLEAHQKAIS